KGRRAMSTPITAWKQEDRNGPAALVMLVNATTILGVAFLPRENQRPTALWFFTFPGLDTSQAPCTPETAGILRRLLSPKRRPGVGTDMAWIAPCDGAGSALCWSGFMFALT